MYLILEAVMEFINAVFLTFWDATLRFHNPTIKVNPIPVKVTVSNVVIKKGGSAKI
jgi:hypothetical protein